MGVVENCWESRLSSPEVVTYNGVMEVFVRLASLLCVTWLEKRLLRSMTVPGSMPLPELQVIRRPYIFVTSSQNRPLKSDSTEDLSKEIGHNSKRTS